MRAAARRIGTGRAANRRDAARSHQQLHESHFSFLDPDEARFVTPEDRTQRAYEDFAREVIART